MNNPKNLLLIQSMLEDLKGMLTDLLKIATRDCEVPYPYENDKIRQLRYKIRQTDEMINEVKFAYIACDKRQNQIED